MMMPKAVRSEITANVELAPRVNLESVVRGATSRPGLTFT